MNHESRDGEEAETTRRVGGRRSREEREHLLHEYHASGETPTRFAAQAGLKAGTLRVTHLGCWSHARRYLVKAVDAGERGAEPYLGAINQLFRLERRARHFKLTEENRAKLRRRFSQPNADKLFADACRTPAIRRGRRQLEPVSALAGF